MIIVTGTIAYDYIMDFPGQFGDHILPDQIHKINVSFVVDKFEKRRGGTAGNVSYSLGLLQVPHTLFSVAGKDFDEYKTTFEKIGIDTSHVRIEPEVHTATGFAVTDRDNNQIWGFFYGASEKNPELVLRDVATKDDLVVVGPAGAEGSMSMIDQCIDLGVEYLFDPAFILTRITDADLEKGIKHAKYLAGNEYEMQVIKNRIAGAQEYFDNMVIITTLGEEGAVVIDKTKKYTIPRVPVDQVVDPTGAGDAWRSGFLAGLAKGYDLQKAGQMGSVAASFVVEVYGCQEHAYTVEEFATRYKKTFGEDIM